MKIPNLCFCAFSKPLELSPHVTLLGLWLLMIVFRVPSLSLLYFPFRVFMVCILLEWQESEMLVQVTWFKKSDLMISKYAERGTVFSFFLIKFFKNENATKTLPLSPFPVLGAFKFLWIFFGFIHQESISNFSICCYNLYLIHICTLVSQRKS